MTSRDIRVQVVTLGSKDSGWSRKVDCIILELGIMILQRGCSSVVTR